MSSFDFAADLVESLKNNGFSFLLICTKDGIKKDGGNVVMYRSSFKSERDIDVVLSRVDKILNPIKKTRKKIKNKSNAALKTKKDSLKSK